MFMQFFNIFIIIVAFILINIYYCQVYIAQIMKLDVIFFVMGVNIYLVTTELLLSKPRPPMRCIINTTLALT